MLSTFTVAIILADRCFVIAKLIVSNCAGVVSLAVYCVYVTAAWSSWYLSHCYYAVSKNE